MPDGSQRECEYPIRSTCLRPSGKVSPAWGPSNNEVAQRWQKRIDLLDGFIMVTPEYNRGPAAVLKNALDYAYKEWNQKPVAFVAYGGVGGARAVEQLRLHAIELKMAPILSVVHIQFPVYLAVSKEGKIFNEFPEIVQSANMMFDQLLWWVKALKWARANEVTAERAA